MTDLREDVALAGNPTNLWTERRVRDGDTKLGALGLADALGAMLWRLKYKGDHRVAARALVLLANRLREDHRWARTVSGRGRTRGASGDQIGAAPDLIDRLAFRVLMEWVNDRCTTCHGRGTVGQMGSLSLCPSCNGSSKQPPQHSTRARDLGVSRSQYHTRWEWVIEALLGQMAQVDEDVRCVLKEQIAGATLHPSADRKAA